MKYTETHEWVELEGDVATVGITDYAQKELGEIVYVELPEVGLEIEKDAEVIVLESTKAAVDIYTPLSGTLVEVNEQLRKHPQLINESPTKKGYLFKIKVSNPEQIEKLFSKPQD